MLTTRAPSAASPAAGPAGPAAVASRRPVRVTVVGATGYAGGELVRLLAQHPAVEVVGLVARGRSAEPLGTSQPHLAELPLTLDESAPEADLTFLALPHGVAAAQVPALISAGQTVIDLGPDFRLSDPAAYPAWYGFEHPAPELLAAAVYGLPELHREALSALGGRPGGIVASPGCYPTAAVLALAPLARAGLIGDLVVDAKSGVSGAGREVKPEMLFGEVNENVRAYGVAGHRHTPEITQELVAATPEGSSAGAVEGLEFVPHLIPMTRGILATCYVQPAEDLGDADLAALYERAYGDEPFVHVVDAAPSTKHVLGTNHARVFARRQPRTGRIVAMAVIDNLLKGAAGQAVQAMNLVLGLDERTGLGALPVNP